MKNYVEDLFAYVGTFEEDYSAFQTEAFLQTYNGIYTVFQPLREQRDQAVELDYFLLDKIKETPLTRSDLRQTTVQLLITYFESEADTDGRSNQSYTYCRSLRTAKQDVTFFENALVPLLFKDGSLNDDFDLNSFFLREIARYLNRFGKRIKVDLTPEEFSAMKEPLKLLELMRRKLELGNDLLRDRQSLEFHLQQVDSLSKLGLRSRLFSRYLSEWNYVRSVTVWSRIRGWFAVLWGKYKGALSSSRYTRLVVLQRKPAYFAFVLVILFFLLTAALLPGWWKNHSSARLDRFRKRASEVRQGIGK